MAIEQSTTKPPLGEGVHIIELQQLGQTMEEGTVVSCHVCVGDVIQKGTVLFDIETDKATMEMESPSAGVVHTILVEAGHTIPVATAMLVLTSSKDVQVPHSAIEALKSGSALKAAQIRTQTPVVATSPPPPATAGYFFEKPGEKQVYKLGQKVPVSRLGKIMAERMLQSKRDIPCFYLNLRADMTEIVKHREYLNRTGNIKISYNDIIIKAMAMAIKQFPIMTGQLSGNYIQIAKNIGIGLAMAVDDGLVAPILKDPDKKSVMEIARESRTLIERAKNGKLEPADLEGGCITLSNLGAFGIESFIPIVIPGQCSIIGAGKILDTTMPLDGNIIVRKMMSLTIAVDHKVANGAYAAQFLDYIRTLLEDISIFEQ